MVIPSEPQLDPTQQVRFFSLIRNELCFLWYIYIWGFPWVQGDTQRIDEHLERVSRYYTWKNGFYFLHVDDYYKRKRNMVDLIWFQDIKYIKVKCVLPSLISIVLYIHVVELVQLYQVLGFGELVFLNRRKLSMN